MAPRPSWRGYLMLSLVTCPVAMLPATSSAEKVRFHTLDRATGNRVQRAGLIRYSRGRVQVSGRQPVSEGRAC
jgi:non-homologous end joining protein Ku